jgi:hypothetical protein
VATDEVGQAPQPDRAPDPIGGESWLGGQAADQITGLTIPLNAGWHINRFWPAHSQLPVDIGGLFVVCFC